MSCVACCLYKQGRAGLRRIVNYLLKNFDVGMNKERVTRHVKNAISVQTVNGHFDKLEQTLDGINPDSLYNNDETKLADDPGTKRVICRRSVKHCVLWQCHWHLQWCYTKHKKEWTRGGPNGTVYDCTDCKSQTQFCCTASFTS